MNLQENISRVKDIMSIPQMNIMGNPLEICSENPMTGFFRDGFCRTNNKDSGVHTVCAEVNDEFLKFTKSKGNDLSFLNPGDRWCLCADRWKEAREAGVAPKIIKNATNIKTLEVIEDLVEEKNDEELSEYSRTLKNARQQGVGLRFPKSAIKSVTQRFRPYNR